MENALRTGAKGRDCPRLFAMLAVRKGLGVTLRTETADELHSRAQKEEHACRTWNRRWRLFLSCRHCETLFEIIEPGACLDVTDKRRLITMGAHDYCPHCHNLHEVKETSTENSPVVPLTIIDDPAPEIDPSA